MERPEDFPFDVFEVDPVNKILRLKDGWTFEAPVKDQSAGDDADSPPPGP